jgi:hypothetical protein
MDHESRDYAFKARHSLIAKFVFEHALKTPAEKASQIIRVLEHLNLEYSADSEAFSHLIKGKQLAEIFGDKALASRIYDAATKTGANMNYILHQKAVYELNHAGCDTKAALSIILSAEKSLSENKVDRAILHTKAMIYKKLARESKASLEIEKYRTEARIIFDRLISGNKDSRAYNGLAELQLDELDDRISAISDDGADDLTDRAFIELVKKSNPQSITVFKNSQTTSIFLLDKKIWRSNCRTAVAQKILEEAYRSNNSSEFVTIRLARQRLTLGDAVDAESILRTGLVHNPNSKPLHLELAKLLIGLNDDHKNTEIEHHLKRSFSPSDTNYDAQFWYARHQYLHGDRGKSKETFAFLKRARMSPWQKIHFMERLLVQMDSISCTEGRSHRSMLVFALLGALS